MAKFKKICLEEFDDDDDSGFGVSDDEMMRLMQGAVELHIAKARLLGVPVVRYDSKLHKVYLEHNDGRREYVT